MISFSNSTFQGGNVRIDNVKYVGCSFSGCVVEYGGEGPISLDNCSFDNCTWMLVGNALHTVGFLTTMQHSFGEFGKAMVNTIIAEIISPKSTPETVNLPDNK